MIYKVFNTQNGEEHILVLKNDASRMNVIRNIAEYIMNKDVVSINNTRLEMALREASDLQYVFQEMSITIDGIQFYVTLLDDNEKSFRLT